MQVYLQPPISVNHRQNKDLKLNTPILVSRMPRLVVIPFVSIYLLKYALAPTIRTGRYGHCNASIQGF